MYRCLTGSYFLAAVFHCGVQTDALRCISICCRAVYSFTHPVMGRLGHFTLSFLKPQWLKMPHRLLLFQFDGVSGLGWITHLRKCQGAFHYLYTYTFCIVSCRIEWEPKISLKIKSLIIDFKRKQFCAQQNRRKASYSSNHHLLISILSRAS